MVLRRKFRLPHDPPSGVFPFPVTDTLSVFAQCEFNRQKVKNNHFSHCLITVCCPQTNRKADRVVSMSGQEFPSPRLQESQLRLARADAEPCLLPHCLLCLRPYISPGEPNSHDAIPRFHLSQAKRGETMRGYSKNLIKSSCPL